MRGEKQKKQKSLSSVNSIFSLKKIQREKKKKEVKRWRSKIKSLYPQLVARKQFSQEKLTTGTRTVCSCHRDNSDHEVCVSSLSNKHFEKKRFSKKI